MPHASASDGECGPSQKNENLIAYLGTGIFIA